MEKGGSKIRSDDRKTKSVTTTMKYSFLYYGDVIKINSMMRRKKGGLL